MNDKSPASTFAADADCGGDALQAALLAEHWGRLEPLVVKALERDQGRYLAEDLKAEVQAGRMKFFPRGGSVAIVQILQYPRMRAIQFVLAAGELRELIPLHDKLLDWAKSIGCSAAYGAGRFGWDQIGKARGYTRPAAVFYKEL